MPRPTPSGLLQSALGWRTLLISLFVLAGLGANEARGQSLYAAEKTLDLSGFAGLTEASTGFADGRNLGLTAGLNLGMHPFRGVLPSLELRGRVPFGSAVFVTEKNVAGGLQMQKRLGAFAPHLDLLLGRTQFTYSGAGVPAPGTYRIYTASASGLIAAGGGVEVPFNRWALIRVDAQAELTHSPITTSGHLISVPVTVALVYRVQSTQHGHPYGLKRNR